MAFLASTNKNNFYILWKKHELNFFIHEEKIVASYVPHIMKII